MPDQKQNDKVWISGLILVKHAAFISLPLLSFMFLKQISVAKCWDYWDNIHPFCVFIYLLLFIMAVLRPHPSWTQIRAQSLSKTYENPHWWFLLSNPHILKRLVFSKGWLSFFKPFFLKCILCTFNLPGSAVKPAHSSLQKATQRTRAKTLEVGGGVKNSWNLNTDWFSCR